MVLEALSPRMVHCAWLRAGCGGRCGGQSCDCALRRHSALSAIDGRGAFGATRRGDAGRRTSGRDAGPGSFIRGLHAATGDLSHARTGHSWRAGGGVTMTNAAGGIQQGYSVGQLVALSDHITQMGWNPLTGPNEPRFAIRKGAGLRFFDMTRGVFKAAARAGKGRRGRRGVCAGRGRLPGDAGAEL